MMKYRSSTWSTKEASQRSSSGRNLRLVADAIISANHQQLNYGHLLLIIAIATIGSSTNTARAEGQLGSANGLAQVLGRCRIGMAEFDPCMKDVFNELRAFFPTGVPDYHIRPFDPHHCDFVELRRGDQNVFGGIKLILRNVSEYGWTRSEVTKYHTDYEGNRIVYSQYFPEKSLQGSYEFSGKIFGTKGLRIVRKGYWNMTLYDYSQTTSVRRIGPTGGLLKVHVEVDRIGGLKMHISNFLAEGRAELNSISDGVINSMWPIGLPFIKPIINELVSTAFTDIFNESFRYFPIDTFLS